MARIPSLRKQHRSPSSFSDSCLFGPQGTLSWACVEKIKNGSIARRECWVVLAQEVAGDDAGREGRREEVARLSSALPEPALSGRPPHPYRAQGALRAAALPEGTWGRPGAARRAPHFSCIFSRIGTIMSNLGRLAGSSFMQIFISLQM